MQEWGHGIIPRSIRYPRSLPAEQYRHDENYHRISQSIALNRSQELLHQQKE